VEGRSSLRHAPEFQALERRAEGRESVCLSSTITQREPTGIELAGGALTRGRRRTSNTHRAVEKALSIHANVEASLHALDGYHPQSDRDEVKKG
ncbi:uncharacterized, partial [Tachysurus ichikawai]